MIATGSTPFRPRRFTWNGVRTHRLSPPVVAFGRPPKSATTPSRCVAPGSQICPRGAWHRGPCRRSKIHRKTLASYLRCRNNFTAFQGLRCLAPGLKSRHSESNTRQVALKCRISDVGLERISICPPSGETLKANSFHVERSAMARVSHCRRIPRTEITHRQRCPRFATLRGADPRKSEFQNLGKPAGSPSVSVADLWLWVMLSA